MNTIDERLRDIDRLIIVFSNVDPDINLLYPQNYFHISSSRYYQVNEFNKCFSILNIHLRSIAQNLGKLIKVT